MAKKGVSLESFVSFFFFFPFIFSSIPKGNRTAHRNERRIPSRIRGIGTYPRNRVGIARVNIQRDLPPGVTISPRVTDPSRKDRENYIFDTLAVSRVERFNISPRAQR